jgi:Zn-dependent M28 family amino/carboxypeptidase
LIYNTKKSLGSIDNASGMAVSIEVAKLIKENPLENYDVIVIFTGAEEWGLLGSKRYCTRNQIDLQEKYNLDKSLNINIDMVGSYIGLVQDRKDSERISDIDEIHYILDEVANDLNIKVKKHHPLIIPKSDHKSFKKLARKTKSKLQTVFFHSGKDSKHIHSHRDTPDKVNPIVLENAVNLVYNSIKTLDSRV